MTRLVTHWQRLATSGAELCKSAVTFAMLGNLILHGHERSTA